MAELRTWQFWRDGFELGFRFRSISRNWTAFYYGTPSPRGQAQFISEQSSTLHNTCSSSVLIGDRRAREATGGRWSRESSPARSGQFSLNRYRGGREDEEEVRNRLSYSLGRASNSWPELSSTGLPTFGFDGAFSFLLTWRRSVFVDWLKIDLPVASVVIWTKIRGRNRRTKKKPYFLYY
jgi:hypothetical protein